jgi:penicillin-binding protein 1C
MKINKYITTQYIKKYEKLLLFLLTALLLVLIFLPPSRSRIEGGKPLRILSKEGTLLRNFRTKSEGSYGSSLSLHEYPDKLISILLYAEDKRFYSHMGVDPFALMRAFFQNIRNGRIISGGSTITQQLVRIAWHDVIPRNVLPRKFFEMYMALKIEIYFSKETILESYLNRVPMRYNRSGLAAASKNLFGRDIRFITEEEMTALVVLIRRSSTSPGDFRKRFNTLWYSLHSEDPVGLNQIVENVFSNKKSDSVTVETTNHFEEWIVSLNSVYDGDFHTTISSNLNQRISEIVSSELEFLRRYNVSNAAVIVLKTEPEMFTLEALVGSEDFSQPEFGQINGALAVRTGGSTLKPFVYALAMDNLGMRPNTIVSDRSRGYPTRNGETYYPRNYDLEQWGSMTIREALGTSRNIPAIDVLSKIGYERFYDILINIGFDYMEEGPEYYGYGLALGSGGVRLIQLTQMYAAIQNKGVMLPIHIGTDDDNNQITYGKSSTLMSARTSVYLTSILSDKDVRRRAVGYRSFLDFPFDVALKTGTSKDYRDAWTVGFINGYTVGVWTGNFNSSAMHRVSGAWGAGRIFHQVIRTLAGDDQPVFTYSDEYEYIELCRETGQIPHNGCNRYSELLHRDDIAQLQKKIQNINSYNVIGERAQIVQPASGEEFILNPLYDETQQPVPVRIQLDKNTDQAVSLIIDGEHVRFLDSSFSAGMHFARGEHSIILMLDDTILDKVYFRVR